MGQPEAGEGRPRCRRRTRQRPPVVPAGVEEGAASLSATGAYPLPRWIAHRGGGSLAPENSLAGLRLAAHLGFLAVEFDVMLTADGIPILMHDETVDRTTEGHGRVAELPWKAIARLDAGRRFHRAWTGEPVPLLNDALALCERLGLAPNVEIKPATGHEAATGHGVAEVVRRVWPAGRPLLFSSFSDTALAAARDAAPAFPRALLVEDVPTDWRQRLAAVDAMALHAAASRLAPDRLQELRAAGVPVAAYTVNTSAAAQHCLDLGLAAVFTDRLDCLGPN